MALAHERIWADAAGRVLLEDLGCRDGADLIGLAREGALLGTGRQSFVVRLDRPRPLLLKVRRTLPGFRWRTLLRPSRERREARAFVAARARGIGVPLPLLVGERRRGLLLESAVLLRPWAEGYRTAREVLAAPGGGARLGEIAAALRDWHDRGFRHGDCWPKNLLLAEGGAPPLPIGFGAARFRSPGPGADAARIGDLARFAAGLAEALPEADPLAFLDVYRRAATGGDPGDWSARVAARRRSMDERLERRAAPPATGRGGPDRIAPLEGRPALTRLPLARL